MYSKYKLNKQGDSMQPCRTPFQILNQSVAPYKVLVVASWPTYRFLLRKVRWPNIPISLSSFHSYCDPHNQRFLHNQWSRNRCFFLEFRCFLYDTMDVDNLNSDSSSFSKPSLYIWKFSVHILLKPNLENFEHNLTSMCSIVWQS